MEGLEYLDIVHERCQEDPSVAGHFLDQKAQSSPHIEHVLIGHRTVGGCQLALVPDRRNGDGHPYVLVMTPSIACLMLAFRSGSESTVLVRHLVDPENQLDLAGEDCHVVNARSRHLASLVDVEGVSTPGDNLPR